MRLIREAPLDLVAPALAAGLLFLAVQEVVRRPGLNTAMLGGLVPVTMHKSPWPAGIIAVLVAWWLGARAIGGARGTLWGAWRWLLRVGLWWGAVALVLFIGVAVSGALTHHWSDLDWGFALAYLTVVIPIVLTCGTLLQHDAPFGPHSD